MDGTESKNTSGNANNDGGAKPEQRAIYVIGDEVRDTGERDANASSNGANQRPAASTAHLEQSLRLLLQANPNFLLADPALQTPDDSSIVLLHDTGQSPSFKLPTAISAAIENQRASVVMIVTRAAKSNASGIETLSFDPTLLDSLRKNQQRVTVVLSLTTARCGGAAIGRCLSIESAVEDYSAERRLFEPLRAIGIFRHLFVMAGADGLIHIRANLITDREEPHEARVYFDPYHDQLPINAVDAAADLDESAEFVASLLNGWHKGAWPDEGSASEKLDEWPTVKDALSRIRTADSRARKARNEEHTGSDADYRSVPVPQYLLTGPLPGRLRAPMPWHMLDDGLHSASIHRVNVAMAIAFAGPENVLNKTWEAPEIAKRSKQDPDGDEVAIWRILSRGETWNPDDRAPDYVTLEARDYPALPPTKCPRTSEIIGDTRRFEVNVPIVRFGALTVAEREEIERLRSIRNLLHRYLKDKKDTKPISIAVFGPPGSGKTFSVEQICEKLDPKHETIRQVEINVSQLQSSTELMKELKRTTSTKVTKHDGKETVDDRIPLVFFDEFDSALDSEPLGWLKFFLAPMWGGKFQGCGERPFSRAIFVFAGGVSSSFESFVPVKEAPDEELGFEVSHDHKQRVHNFRQQKGPDFVSRLAGHINILPINEKAGRIKHFIRRAIQLRSVLERKGYVEKAPESNPKKVTLAKVDQSILYALLTIDRYNHGVRSMESIVRMCVPIGNRIEIASLPSRAQLNMHVDADEFYRRVYRGRARIPHEDTETIIKMREVALALRDYRETPSETRLTGLKAATECLE